MPKRASRWYANLGRYLGQDGDSLCNECTLKCHVFESKMREQKLCPTFLI